MYFLLITCRYGRHNHMEIFYHFSSTVVFFHDLLNYIYQLTNSQVEMCMFNLKLIQIWFQQQ